MGVSRKNVAAIAAQLKVLRNLADGTRTPEAKIVWLNASNAAVRLVAIALADDNPAFDREKFTRACC